MKRTWIAIGATLCGFAGVVALGCGGDESSTPVSPGASGSGGASGNGGSTTYTLENVCDLVMPKLCADRQECCVKAGEQFDQAGCEAYEKTNCENDVADAKAGKLTFNPSQIDECLAGVKAMNSKCSFVFSDYYASLPTLRICSGIFEGNLADGADCERDSQCALSTDPDTFNSCEEDTGKCTSVEFLSDGEPCAVGEGAEGWCKNGLYCDAELRGQAPYHGTCKPVTPPLGACDTTAALSLECGIGNYCNKTSGKCEVGKAGGEDCATDLECLSLDCDTNTKKCLPVGFNVDPETCSGTST